MVERVGQSLKLTDRKDGRRRRSSRGGPSARAVPCRSRAASKHHDPSDPNKTKVLKRFIYVVDMKNVKTWHATPRCRDRFRSIMQTMELAYPEVAWRTYVVNACVQPRQNTLQRHMAAAAADSSSPETMDDARRGCTRRFDPVTTSRVAILGTDQKKVQ